MQLLLTSNFPGPGYEQYAAVLGRWSDGQPFQWLGLDADRYEECRAEFSKYGLVLCARAPLLAGTPRRIYLAGGPPTQLKTAMAPALAAAGADDTVLVAASGGAMLCTSNVSLYRLSDISAEQAVQEWDQYRGLGYVPFELLPHFDRHPASFIDEVRRYSEAIDSDIWCLPDGAAIAITERGAESIGAAKCMRRGDFLPP